MTEGSRKRISSDTNLRPLVGGMRLSPLSRADHPPQWAAVGVSVSGQHEPSPLWQLLRRSVGWTETKRSGELHGFLFGFLTSSSTTRLYCGRAPRQSVWQFYVLPHMRHSWETMTSVSAGHIILTPTQPVGSGRPQRQSNPGSPNQKLHALPTELPRPPRLMDLR